LQSNIYYANIDTRGDAMTFKRARTDAQIEERRKEILAACAQLFDNGDIDDVHFKAIGEKTSFGRSTIYKYYTTKEEILLDLLLEDVKVWTKYVSAFTEKHETLSKEDFCLELTKTYVNNDRMLKLMSILYSIIEKNCSLEKLAEFKSNLTGFTDPLYLSIHKYFPEADEEAIQTFIYTSSNYILGLYPTTHISEKQKQAIILSGFDYKAMDFEDMCCKGFLLLSSEL